MALKIRQFLKSDSGAVTVDWVVLTAAVVGLGMASAASIRTGTSALGSDINTSLDDATVASLGELGDDNYTGGWVSHSLRGTQYTSTCRVGSDCTPTTYTYLGYMMEDGSTWNMSSVQVQGEEAVVEWRDGSGNIVDEPRFR